LVLTKETGSEPLSAWRFYPKYLTETAVNQMRWIWLYLRLRRLYLCIKRDPERLRYTDFAMAAVADDEAETRALFHTAAAQAYPRRSTAWRRSGRARWRDFQRQGKRMVVAAMMLLAAASLAVPSAFSRYFAPEGTIRQEELLNLGIAGVLLLTYALYLLFSLKTHRGAFASVEGDEEGIARRKQTLEQPFSEPQRQDCHRRRYP
jgi:hypothetical protein